MTVKRNGTLLDTAGTGGDGAHTFNISTTAAFVIAGAGRQVAKHGNRAASSRCGSADVLAALGVNLDLTPEQVGRCIDEVGIGFLFAPKFHPAMKHAIGPRAELGQRTIFNVLGPLTNPAGATHQIIGVYDPALTHMLAEVLGSLGSEAALVLHGYGGLDELTTGGPNRISHLRDGNVSTFDLDAFDPCLPFQRCDVPDLRGGDPAQNARILRDILCGRGPRPAPRRRAAQRRGGARGRVLRSRRGPVRRPARHGRPRDRIARQRRGAGQAGGADRRAPSRLRRRRSREPAGRDLRAQAAGGRGPKKRRPCRKRCATRRPSARPRWTSSPRCEPPATGRP